MLKLLCWLGIHRWGPWFGMYPNARIGSHGTFAYIEVYDRTCISCGKRECEWQFTNEDWPAEIVHKYNRKYKEV